MKTLRIPVIKRKWFEMTKSGEKKEDYREITEYWFKRFVYDYKNVFKYLSGWGWDYLSKNLKQVHLQLMMDDKLKRNMIEFNPFDENTVSLFSPKKSDLIRTIKLEHKGIELGRGKLEWGGNPNELYFIIKHGEIIT